MARFGGVAMMKLVAAGFALFVACSPCIGIAYNVVDEFADPRNYGGVCNGDGVTDIGPAVRTAFTYYPAVRIPAGCTLATQIKALAPGWRLTSVGGFNYSSPPIQQPGDVFIPSNFAANNPTNAVIDYNGFPM